MNLFGASGLIIAITSTAFAVIVFIHNYKNPLNRVWALVALSVAGWGTGAYFATRATNPEEALVWWRAANASVILIPVFYIHFVWIFLELHKKSTIYIGYLLGFFFLLADLTPYFISHVRYAFSSFYYTGPGPLYAPFILFFFGAFAFTHYFMYKKYREVTETKRGQILYFSLASIIGVIGGGTSFLPAYRIEIYPFLNFAIVLYPAIMGYAILKYKLFNIKVVAAELLVSAISILLLVEIFFSRTPTEILFRSILFILVLGLGLLLIWSVIREVRTREKITFLAGELKKSNEELKSLDQTKSEFISIASHQLRTPLTSVKGYLSMMLEGDFGQLNLGLQEKISRIYQTTQRLIRIVNDLLDLTKIEQKKLEYVFAPMKIEELLKKIFNDFEGAAKDRGLDLTLNIPQGIPAITGDEEKLYHVFGNLVDNALHYTQKGSVTIGASLTPVKVAVTIKDTGIGMTTEEIERLFTKYHRGADVAKIHTEGAGLGLYVAKQIVEDHGGKIMAQSEGKGKGSTFFVELPIRQK